LISLLALALTATSVVGCGDDDDDDNGGGTVDVTLDEFKITASPKSVSAGTIEFVVENVGDEEHEFLVIQTDLDEDDLPLADAGGVDEEGKDIKVLDEIEDIEPGATKNLTIDLDSGSYVLICNMVEEEDGGVVSHYVLGMHVAFTVN
jgi:uncharacterized cupredoxin-like copper-binding protein